MKPDKKKSVREILDMLDKDIRRARSARTVQECCATETPTQLKKKALSDLADLVLGEKKEIDPDKIDAIMKDKVFIIANNLRWNSALDRIAKLIRGEK